MSSLFCKILSQPLVHFILIATLLLVFASAKNGLWRDRSNELVITRATLAEFIQARQGMFSSDSAEKTLAMLDEAAYKALLEDVVREEVLFREAKNLGMPESDYVIRRRLVQKVEYLARGFGSNIDEPDEAMLQAWFDTNKERYREPQRFSFSHVFINQDDPGAELRAYALLDKLNRESAGFADAVALGDRFIYHSHYLEREAEFITSHFGNEFTSALLDYEADSLRWIGPLRSRYGFHLLKLSAVHSGGVPELQEIHNRVYRDVLEDKISAGAELFVDELVNSYKISAPEHNDLLKEE